MLWVVLGVVVGLIILAVVLIATGTVQFGSDDDVVAVDDQVTAPDDEVTAADDEVAEDPDAGTTSGAAEPMVMAESMMGDPPDASGPAEELQGTMETVPEGLETMTMAPRPRPTAAPVEAMSMTDDADEFAAVLAAAVPLAYGESASIAHGADEIVGVTFDGRAGEYVIVSAVSLTQGDPFIGLIGPSGDLLLTDADSGEGQSALLSVQGLPEDGTYLAVGLDDTGQPGELDFFVESGLVAFELLDEVNQVFDGAIHDAQLVAGTRLLVRVRSAAEIILLIAQGDQVVADNATVTDDATDLSFDVATTGDYQIVVLGPEGQDFEYTIIVTEVQFAP